MNPSELTTLAAEASERIADIQRLCGRTEAEEAKISFPRGFIITAGKRRMRLAFVRRNSVRNNIAYTLILYDVYLWVLKRTDLAGTARDMLVKACLATLGAVVEALLNDWYAGRMGKRQKFTSRTKRLVHDGIIDAGLQGELDWLWDMRCRQHLYELSSSEFEFYSIADQRRAALAVGNLLERLNNVAAA